MNRRSFLKKRLSPKEKVTLISPILIEPIIDKLYKRYGNQKLSSALIEKSFGNG